MHPLVRFKLIEENWPDDPGVTNLPDFDPVLLGDLILGSPDDELSIRRVDLIAYVDVLLLTIGLAAAFAAPQSAGGERSTSVVVRNENVTLTVANMKPATYPLASLSRGLGEVLVDLVTIILAKCPELLGNPLLRGWNFVRAYELARARGAPAPKNSGVLRVRFVNNDPA